MSRSCAKPTCSSVATSWFAMSRETQQVTRRDVETAEAIALCTTHADRFGVPAGWQLATESAATETAMSEPETDLSADDAAVGAESAAPANGRDKPWFVTDSTSHAGDEVELARSEPQAGSMLHRAFNGPERSESNRDDTQLPADELGRRRRARSIAGDPDHETDESYQTSELPFPPHGRSIAVS